MSIEKNFNELALSHVPIVQCAENFPESKKALTDVETGRTWTYKELNKDINRLAHSFQEVQLVKGDVIMGSLLNGSEFILSMYAALKTGSVFSPINFRLPPGDLAYHLEDSKPKIYIYDSELEDIARDALRRSSHKPTMIISSGELENRSKDKPETDPPFPDDITPFDEALRLYTSGTTGKAKGVPLSHLANWLIVSLVCWQDQWFPVDRILALSPFFHRAGNNAGFMPALGCGAHVYTLKHFDPKAALDIIEKDRITFVMGAPPMFAGMISMMMQKKNEGKKWDVSSLKGLDTMGAPLTRALYESMCENLTRNIFNSDGNSESGWDIKQSPWAPADKWSTTPVMNGIACPLHYVRVVKVYSEKKADPDDIVPRDGKTEGEMIVKCLFHDDHYHNKPERTEASFRNGWFYTGDVVTWDEDGYFSIRSRSGDMILSGAENIYPEEVEAVLNEHPKVEDSVVVGVPDEMMGEKVGAYIRSNDPSITAEELDQYLVEHPKLARYKRPRYYKFIKDIPYTVTGKKIRYQLRDHIVEDLASGELKAV